MQTGGRRQFRLWWGMALIGVVALFAGAITQPFDNVALGALLAVLLGFLLLSLYVLLVVVPYHVALRFVRCPICSHRSLRCTLLILFRPPLASVHECPACGVCLHRRFPRRWVAGFETDPPRPPLVEGLTPSSEPSEATT